MNNRMILLICITLGLLAAPGLVSATGACQLQSGNNFKVLNVFWGNSTHPISAGPGQSDVPLTISVENYGYTCTMTDIGGAIALTGGLSNFNGSNTATYYTATATPAEIINMVFYLNIGQNVSAGPNVTMAYPFYVTWNTTNSTTRYDEEINLGIPMHGSANLVYSMSGSGLVTGELDNMSISVQNQGSGTLTGIRTSIASASGLSVISQPAEISSLGPGQKTTVYSQVYATSSSTGAPLTLTLDTDYISPYGYNTTQTTDLGVYTVASSTPPVSVSLSNESLLAGVVRTDNVVISNNGAYPLQNASVQLTPSGSLSLIGSDGYLVFPTIAPHTSAGVPVQLYESSTTSTVASLGISLQYLSNGQSQSVSRTLSFLTPGYVNLTQESVVLLPAHPTAGSIFSLTATLDNSGSEEAFAATAFAKPPRGFSTIGGNSSFIGDIQTATPTAYTLSFSVSPTIQPGSYTIPVTLSYLNNLNQRVNTTFDYPVVIAAASAVGSNGIAVRSGNYSGGGTYVRTTGGFPWIVVILIIIIIAVVGYYLYTRRKKAESKKTETKAHGK